MLYEISSILTECFTNLYLAVVIDLISDCSYFFFCQPHDLYGCSSEFISGFAYDMSGYQEPDRQCLTYWPGGRMFYFVTITRHGVFSSWQLVPLYSMSSARLTYQPMKTGWYELWWAGERTGCRESLVLTVLCLRLYRRHSGNACLCLEYPPDRYH